MGAAAPVERLTKASSPVERLTKAGSPVERLTKAGSPVKRLKRADSPVELLVGLTEQWAALAGKPAVEKPGAKIVWGSLAKLTSPA